MFRIKNPLGKMSLAELRLHETFELVEHLYDNLKEIYSLSYQIMLKMRMLQDSFLIPDIEGLAATLLKNNPDTDPKLDLDAEDQEEKSS